MTRRYPVSPAPGPLEDYAHSFDDLFGARAQRHSFRRYLEGLLLPAERNKTLTALANTEPVSGAQRKEARSLQWFLSESRWDPEKINERRLEVLLGESTTAADEEGVLVIDTSMGTANGTSIWPPRGQAVAGLSIGKTESGVVSVSSLLADEKIYWPVNFEPYTPAHHFEGARRTPSSAPSSR